MTAATGPPPGMAESADDLTPMLAQYYELCDTYEDSLVLFQVGDFYEAFCEAAEEVARICEVTLTKREDSTGEYPMAGLPVDNAAAYLEPLLAAGYRVAVADQVEDAEEATGLVDRAVTRVVTPGTLTDDELLTSATNYAACVVDADDRRALAAVDVSTGECRVTSSTDSGRIAEELDRLGPAEVLVGPDADLDASALSIDPMRTDFDPEAFAPAAARETVAGYADPDAVLANDAEVRACGALLAYAEYTQGDADRLAYVSRIGRYDPREFMRLDATALASLELFENRGTGGGRALVDALADPSSALGRRRLTDWLRRPLIDREAIEARHAAVGDLCERSIAREELRDRLREVYDVERLISRASRGRANARDLRSLKGTLDVVPDLKAELAEAEAPLLADLRARLDELEDVRDLIGEAIRPDPPQEVTEGGVIREGFDAELDELRSTERAGREWVADLEERERERTGIDSLEVGYNQVHGYYIEVTDPNLDRVPEDYTRRQTLKNSERFYTPELKRREDEILGAAERADKLEYERFREVREAVAAEADRVNAVADAVADLDALATLAATAVEAGYVRPEMGADAIEIDAGRHPVVEGAQDSFVPNDTRLGPDGRVAVITGPNMSGKSTYMRQTALIAVLAQAGSFVPADAARLPVLDRVFTRVGASDDIAGGQSTFMREMAELTEILHHATPDSLVLLDEVGRGTSTADGLAIARATTEFVAEEVGAFTLFATHYHDLTALADEREGVFNLHFTVARDGDDVTFLHRVEPGASSSSYGVEVAKMAGVPGPVVERSRELVAEGGADEEDEPDGAGDDADGSEAVGLDQWTDASAPATGSPEAVAASDGGDAAGTADGAGEGTADEPVAGADAVAAALREIDLARTTPLEALNRLHDLQRRLEER
ncbi:MAG: DNA mismatch repair protein MutS [Haloferacaceae archaeon]